MNLTPIETRLLQIVLVGEVKCLDILGKIERFERLEREEVEQLLSLLRRMQVDVAAFPRVLLDAPPPQLVHDMHRDLVNRAGVALTAVLIQEQSGKHEQTSKMDRLIDDMNPACRSEWVTRATDVLALFKHLGEPWERRAAEILLSFVNRKHMEHSDDPESSRTDN